MSQHTQALTCAHGERTDRTTTLGEPICALCRADHRRLLDMPLPMPDWQTVRAADDTLSDDHTDITTDADILAALFADDAQGRRLRHRIRAAL